jgi:hypothetical protein
MCESTFENKPNRHHLLLIIIINIIDIISRSSVLWVVLAMMLLSLGTVSYLVLAREEHKINYFLFFSS